MNQQPDGRLRCQTTSSVHRDFSQYHGKRLAIVLTHRDRAKVYSGLAQYEVNDFLGPVLRIRLNSGKTPGETELLISENEWGGRVLPDSLHGCHFLFIPGQGNRGS